MEKPYSLELIQRSNKSKIQSVKIKPLAKTDFLFRTKPKFPKAKASKSFYKGFWIREVEKTEFIYHVESELFVARMNKFLKQPMEAKSWIDNNMQEIHKRIKDTEC